MDDRTVQVRLIVEGIHLEGRHGVYPEEHEQGNRFRVDIEAMGDFSSAAETDRLDQTVDYTKVVERVEEINRTHRFNLIESFAGTISSELLKRFPQIEDVLVRVQKLSPPGLGSTTCATAEVRRRRA